MGFSSCPTHYPIATGKWGSGAFGGDPLLKTLLQVLVANVTGRKLNIYLFRDKELYEKLMVALSTLEGLSVSESYGKLLSNEDLLT